MTRGNPGASQVIRGYLATQLLWGHHLGRRLGLGSTELATMMHLSIADDVTPGELARTTGLSTAAVSRLVDRLEEKGYVARHHDTDDRRRVLVRLTGTFHERIDAAVEPHRAAMRQAISGLDEAGQRAVFTFMAEAAVTVRAILD